MAGGVYVDENATVKTTDPLYNLCRIFVHRRPHGSKGEQEWVKTHIIDFYRRLAAERAKTLALPQIGVYLLGPMENVVVSVDVNKNPDTMFSCHTDTVHYSDGVQCVIWDTVTQIAYKKDGFALGADDGTGVWLMKQMIADGIPGTYVFHRGEERGCIGSRWIKDNKVAWLKSFKRAIAFDRRDQSDVITTQRGRRCCSDVFATALAEELNAAGQEIGMAMSYKADPTGIYTDTANYVDYIEECTNISIGYDGAHGGSETQDLEFALALSRALPKVNWARLPTVRVAEPEPVRSYGYGFGFGYGGTVSPTAFTYTDMDLNGIPLPWSSANKNGNRKTQKRYTAASRDLETMQQVVLEPPDTLEEFDRLPREERLAFMRCFPEQADLFIVGLLALRRKVIRVERERAEKTATPSVPPASSSVVNSASAPQAQTPTPELGGEIPPDSDWGGFY